MDTAELLRAELRAYRGRPLIFMEVCGTHTVAIFRHGLRSLLPPDVRLLSGPGCPVCVTPDSFFGEALRLSRRPDTLLTTFGDLLRVPTPYGSLAEARARGASIQIVYSPLDVLELATAQPQRRVIFLAVGFETTAPAVGLLLRQARARGLRNLFVLSGLKRLIPALTALFRSGEVKLDGLLCPGHVSTIIGSEAYLPLVERFRLPGVVAGFQAEEILQALVLLLRQVQAGEARIENAYPRAVRPEGNQAAQALLAEVFTPADSRWRGLGEIPASGLELAEAYRAFDASLLLQDKAEARETEKDREGNERGPAPFPCACGEIIKGVLTPPQCPAFGRACTPLRPLGPCMVSQEGSCAAYYRYRGA